MLPTAGIKLTDGWIYENMLKKLHLLALSTCFGLVQAAAPPPAVGQVAPNFELESARGARVSLATLYEKSPVVLVVLRGFPGYQCPFCQRQVADFMAHSKAFKDAGVSVVFVYPGPPDKTRTKAAEFLAGKAFPAEFEMLLDPGYVFTNQYGLRWEANGETAYPSTFYLERGGRIIFAKTAMLHGGRSSATELIEILPKKPSR